MNYVMYLANLGLLDVIRTLSSVVGPFRGICFIGSVSNSE